MSRGQDKVSVDLTAADILESLRQGHAAWSVENVREPPQGFRSPG